MVLQQGQLCLPQVGSALEKVEPFDAVVAFAAVLQRVHKHALGQTAVDIVGYREILARIAEADAHALAALVGFPDAAAQRQREGEFPPSAGSQHPLQLGVHPVCPGTALHLGVQLQRGQPGQLTADDRRQA